MYHVVYCIYMGTIGRKRVPTCTETRYSTARIGKTTKKRVLARVRVCRKKRRFFLHDAVLAVVHVLGPNVYQTCTTPEKRVPKRVLACLRTRTKTRPVA